MALLKRKSVQCLKLADVPAKIRNMLRYRTKHDEYCWQCHRKNPNVFCTTCTRSFHIGCNIKEFVTENELDRKCDQCTSIEKSRCQRESSGLSQGKLNALLDWVLCVCLDGTEILNLDITTEHGGLNKPIDYKTIEQKVKDAKYQSIENFMSDVRRLCHNCYIVHQSNEEMKKAMEKFVAVCDQEIYDISLCDECYERKFLSPSRVMVDICKKVHIVVWAKYKSYPYWPAKAIKTVNSREIEVRFFGQHNTALVPHKKCLLFSKEDPNEQIDQVYEEDFQQSYEEAYEYIKNVEKVFGSYVLPKSALPYSPDYETTYLNSIVPMVYAKQSPTIVQNVESVPLEFEPSSKEPSKFEPFQKINGPKDLIGFKQGNESRLR